MLVAFRVCGFKKYTRNNVGCYLRLWVQKIYPRRCLLLFVSAGSKKCTRNVSEVTAVFMGSKKCTRNISKVVTLFMGLKKCTRGQS